MGAVVRQGQFGLLASAVVSECLFISSSLAAEVGGASQGGVHVQVGGIQLAGALVPLWSALAAAGCAA
jgi:hypothetical protein